MMQHLRYTDKGERGGRAALTSGEEAAPAPSPLSASVAKPSPAAALPELLLAGGWDTCTGP